MDNSTSILIVEDEQAHTEAVRRAFLAADIHATMRVARTLREYQEAVSTERPDIALLDLNLPDGRALDVLVSPPEAALFPVLIMTSYGDEQVAVEAMKAGALDYIVKSSEAFRGIPHTIVRALREWSLLMERKRAEDALRQSEARTRAVYDHLPNPTLVWQRRGNEFVLATFNVAARAMTQGGIAEYIGRSMADMPHDFPGMREDIERCFFEHVPIARELEYRSSISKIPRRLSVVCGFVPPDMVLLHAEDVTERKQMEEQLRVAHRMESVGRLAGGVAHDFNNMLSVILNYTQFALDDMKDGDLLQKDLITIQNAGERAAALTRQLLAFSRKQLLQPRVLDLNAVITGMADMLRRMIGEDITLMTGLAPNLGLVKADPGQIEQVLMNLAVNARDAMPTGGTLTIDTADTDLDDVYTNRHMAVQSGSYVMLSVTDTGIGMDEQTQAKLFEPFFTTKEVGKGTGLGLATVYGIVKQSGGNIRVHSEPNKGSTFTILMPRASGDIPAVVPPSRIVSRAVGEETILLVEDEEEVRRLAERILRTAGYTVLPSTSGEEALRICEQFKGKIHLVLTDIVMPRMSGKELTERLATMYPDLRILYMSGYTDDAIVHHGVLDPKIRFIGKPFNAADITRMVREVLDEPAGSGGRM